jgi:type I restriction enzyme S subunit
MRLGEVCESISLTFRRKQDRVVLINTSDVLDGKVINHVYVPNENLRGQFKKSFQRDDILYSEIRPKNRRFAYVDFEAGDYVASTKLMVIRANDKVLPQFLFQVLKSDEIIEQLQLLAETRSGTFPQITFSELAALEVRIPEISEQREIAATLDAIDGKIANNKKINNHLASPRSVTDNSPDIRRGKRVSRKTDSLLLSLLLLFSVWNIGLTISNHFNWTSIGGIGTTMAFRCDDGRAMEGTPV